ncbi:TetR/AcrR family transcriptional regulator [Staphylococcus xylosus]|uniref:TetR/AcrR family transcriptional regulator n=1 Tax=Staphylococcus xylosus TaxID=1288 RepID=UPI003F543086
MNDFQDFSINANTETRNKLILKLIPIVRKKGFQTLRMEDIAKYMGISKATMYKYFTSKEEIIKIVVDSFVNYINELTIQPFDTVQSFGIKFRELFEQSILLGAYVSDIFVKELKVTYPHLYEILKEAMKKREVQISKFYNEGKSQGIFNDINERLIFLQKDVLIREILDTKFLISNDMTLNQALFDLYKLMKFQLIKSEKMEIMNDPDILKRIEYMARKITIDL